MEPVIIDAGTLEFSEDDLTATGLLIPYGVPARSNLGTFTFAPGDITLDEDLTGMSLNIEHKREHVVGAFSKVWEQPEGVMATFSYRRNAAGRRAFEEGKTGDRKHLSAEVAEVRIRDGKALPGSVLFAAAQVKRPAFEGATLLAAEDTEAVELDTTLAPDEEGHLTVLSSALPADITVNTPDGETATYTPEAAPAEDNPEGGSTVTATATEPGTQTPATTVPTTLLAGQQSAAEEASLGTIFASMAQVKTGMSAPDAETLLAALSDIKYNATGGLTTAASGVLQPAWVGKLWQGKRYQRKYLDLFTHTYGGIQLGGRKGFTLAQGTALVQKWNGNKSDIPSGTATTGTKSSSIQPYGYGADVAREWYDLEGGADVLQAFFEGVVDSYAKVTDEDGLKAVFEAASRTSAALDRLVAPGTFPDVAGHDYPTAMGMVIQAIEAISDADDDAASVVVNPTAWNQLLYTPKELIPEYVSFGVTAGSGQGAADGKVVIKKAAQSFFPGTVPTEPQVLAGAKNAIEFREQGSTPIQIDALDIAKGGIDKAVIGYLETFVVRPEALVLIGTKPA
ncbi:hypothetical protein [Microbacterium dauci]|uniref:Uncharacterized protein n=1 Tax=Microbacterium dauci TaxID=3048008 RepID=A0ABT6ZGW6_9MICO|nr:hypothetical protein [Microbacterium sp. LX3-4]MDJ1115390.1 hypothetical protein [Microbacterium sp. LX3-4]